VFNSNHMSITHRLRYNQVLPLTGNDVIVLHPLGGAASEFHYGIRKGNPDFMFMLHEHFASILNRSQVVRLCKVCWDFSIWGVLGVVFRGYDPQIVIRNSANIQKALSCGNSRLLSH
jgi:hypothetical protein